MATRRGFLGRVLAAVAGVLGLSAAKAGDPVALKLNPAPSAGDPVALKLNPAPSAERGLHEAIRLLFRCRDGKEAETARMHLNTRMGVLAGPDRPFARNWVCRQVRYWGGHVETVWTP